jgi:DNA polymerase III subunit delta
MSKKTAKFTVDPSMRVIVLYGQDPFQITEFTRQAIEVFEKEHGEIERFDFDGEEAELADVLDELRSYGLAQRYKMVVLDKADKFIGGEDRKRFRTAMENYARQPVDSATLIMRAEGWRTGNLDKYVKKVGMIHKVEPPSESRAVGWCRKRAMKEYETEIEPDAAELLVTLVGADLSRLDMEIGKLAAYVAGERPIARREVMDIVGMSREDKVWALQQPIAAGDAAGALTMLREMMEISRQPQELITWSICDLLRKLHAAAQLFKQGADRNSVMKGIGLQHWMDSTSMILGTASRHEPAKLAALLDLAIRTDQHNKSGQGEPIRSLEALTLRIADSMRHGSARPSARGSR